MYKYSSIIAGATSLVALVGGDYQMMALWLIISALYAIAQEIKDGNEK